MGNRGRVVLLVTLASSVAVLGSSGSGGAPEADRYWPGWRGPLMTGVAPHATPPVKWSETKNVRWKVEIPGKGSATPVVWGDRIFVLTAVPTGKRVEVPPPAEPLPDWRRGSGETPEETQQFTVLALDRRDGTTLWKRVVREAAPHEGTHETGHVGFGLAGHRRESGDRLLRLPGCSTPSVWTGRCSGRTISGT